MTIQNLYNYVKYNFLTNCVVLENIHTLPQEGLEFPWDLGGGGGDKKQHTIKKMHQV